MKGKIVAVLLTIAMVLSLATCGTTEDTSSDGASGDAASEKEDDGTITIAFSQGDNGNSWRVTSTDDMQKTVEERGYNFIWADAGADPSKQLSDVEDLLAQNPDILILDPVESEACTPAFDLAEAAGVPMITIDRAINAEVGTGTYVANIEQDFVEVGRLAANYAVEYLTEKNGSPSGNVLLITGTVGSSPNTDEEAGINEVLDEYPDITILDNQSGDYARAAARTVMDDYLNKYPEGSVDCLICFNDEESFGAYQAMQDAGRTDLVGAIISKDGMRDALKEIIDGNFYACVQCTPYFGEVTIDLVEKILNDEDYESEIAIPFTCFDMGENADATQEYYDKLVEDNLDY